MHISGLLEVTLYVRDMARQVAFYRNTISLGISYPSGQADFSTAPGIWIAHAVDPEGNPLAIEQQEK